MRQALVLLSGGLDSTVCLYWARQEFNHVYALTFDYGQSYRLELECAKIICDMTAVEHYVLPINTFPTLATLRCSSDGDIRGQRKRPASLVPNRNLVLFAFAAAYGLDKDIHHLVGGMTRVDQSSYPDCRENTIKAIETAINLSLDETFILHTPLIENSKAKTILLACNLGALEVLAWTHTCASNSFPPCRICPPCILRQQGFSEANVRDPLLQRARSKP